MSIVEVRFKGQRAASYRCAELPLEIDDPVIVEADRGKDFGHISAVGDVAERKCGIGCDGCADNEKTPDPPSRRVIRKASPSDAQLAQELRITEESIRRAVIKRALGHGLVMKISDAEWQWDRNKLTIYFTAEKRIDFRNLVRDLAQQFRTRIELRQIGARDEAKRLSGVGRCGRQYCCSTWLPELQPVSLSLAKDQQLSLNPTQISGGCGRLLCCLRYEHDFYRAARKRFPKQGKKVRTGIGDELVVQIDIFRELVTLRSASGDTRTVPLAQLKREAEDRGSRPDDRPDRSPDDTEPTSDPSAEQASDVVTPTARRRRRPRRRGGRGGSGRQ